jgi:hypothetical protein
MKNITSKEQIEKAKKELSNLYISMKKKINNNVDNEDIIFNTKQMLSKLTILDLIEYIKSSIDIIIDMKIKEDKEEIKLKNNNYDEDYESLLRREEAWIRKHIGIENQLRIDYNNLFDKYKECEKDNIILMNQIVKF